MDCAFPNGGEPAAREERRGRLASLDMERDVLRRGDVFLVTNGERDGKTGFCFDIGGWRGCGNGERSGAQQCGQPGTDYVRACPRDPDAGCNCCFQCRLACEGES